MFRFGVLLILAFSFSLGAAQTQPLPHCATKEACLSDPNCLCWCSQICNWRRKTPEDHPYYVEDDPYGKHCYCKKWDYDYYAANCIEGKNVKQPPGAK